MNEELINICKAELKSEMFEDVAFFKIAEGGAMGEPGGVIWVTNKGEAFHCNYCYGDISREDLLNAFEPLQKSFFGMFGKGSMAPEGWIHVYLGMGNHLLVSESIYDEFKEETKDVSCISEMYCRWYEAALKIIRKKEIY